MLPPGASDAFPLLSDVVGAPVVGGFVANEFDELAFSFIVFMFPFALASVFPLLATLAVVGLHSCNPIADNKAVANKSILIMTVSSYSVLAMRSRIFVRWNT